MVEATSASNEGGPKAVEPNLWRGSGGRNKILKGTEEVRGERTSSRQIILKEKR